MDIIGKIGSLEERLSAVRMKVVGFSVGIPDLQFLLPILDRICKPLKEEPFRIIIYDDDEMAADYFAHTLQNDGMNATFVTDPNELLDDLEELDSRCLHFEYEYPSLLWLGIG